MAKCIIAQKRVNDNVLLHRSGNIVAMSETLT